MRALNREREGKEEVFFVCVCVYVRECVRVSEVT
jgi:hypothetical protein